MARMAWPWPSCCVKRSGGRHASWPQSDALADATAAMHGSAQSNLLGPIGPELDVLGIRGHPLLSDRMLRDPMCDGS
jgi:hypothetical protein